MLDGATKFSIFFRKRVFCFHFSLFKTVALIMAYMKLMAFCYEKLVWLNSLIDWVGLTHFSSPKLISAMVLVYRIIPYRCADFFLLGLVGLFLLTDTKIVR